jgi:hypothetical protein
MRHGQDTLGNGFVRGRVPTEAESTIHHRCNLVNELVEAQQHNAVKRALARWLL